MRYRITLLLFLISATTLLAQTPPRNDLALWGNSGSYGTTHAPAPFSDLELGVHGRAGYGISASHFFRDKLSLTLSADALRGRAKLSATQAGESRDAGPMRLRAYSVTAQWHFLPPWVLDLYAGGGATYFSGGRIDVPATATAEGVAGTIPFRNAWSPVVNAGAGIPLTSHVSAGLDVKWSRYKAKLGTTADNPIQSLRLDPLTFALGVRLHD